MKPSMQEELKLVCLELAAYTVSLMDTLVRMKVLDFIVKVYK